MRRAFPPDVVDGPRRVWAARRPVLDAVARVPVVVCRGDAQRRNLFARREPDGRERTVGIDWANVHAWHVQRRAPRAPGGELATGRTPAPAMTPILVRH